MHKGRKAIYCEVEGKGECLEGEVEMDESYFGGKMEMIELSKIVSDEKKVIQYLQQKAILKNFDSCPYCGSIHI